MALSNDKINKLEKHYIQGKSYSEASKELGIKYDTVKRYFDKWENQNGKNGEKGKKLTALRDDVVESRLGEYKSVVEMMKQDNRVIGIVDKVLMLLNDEKVLKEEIKRGGIRGLSTLLGVITDKGIKIKESEIKELQAKNGINVNVSNNIQSILDMMDKKTPSEVDKNKELEEFTKDKQ